MERWKIFEQILHYRKEACASAKILGLDTAWDKSIAHEPLDSFMNKSLVGIGRDTWTFKQNPIRLIFRAWKPFISQYVKRREVFSGAILYGIAHLKSIKSYRARTRIPCNIMSLKTQISFRGNDNIDHDVYVTLQYDNPQRIRNIQTMLKWVTIYASNHYIKEQEVLKFGSRYHDLKIEVTITNNGKINVTTNKEDTK